MQAETSGWIALGISTNGQMDSGGNGSDIMMGYMNPNVTGCEHGCINGYWAVQFNTPQLNSRQYLQLDNFTSGKRDLAQSTHAAASHSSLLPTSEWRHPIGLDETT